MSTASIDLEALNELLENQKKLDDVFNSTFDDDIFLTSTLLVGDQELEDTDGKNSEDLDSSDDLFFYDDTDYVQKKRNIAFLIMPVALEIAAIYYAFIYFN